MNRIMLTLKDSSVIILDKMPVTLAQRTKEYLEKLKQGKSGNYTTACFKNMQNFVGGLKHDKVHNGSQKGCSCYV